MLALVPLAARADNITTLALGSATMTMVVVYTTLMSSNV
jgi:hypothetical protein